MVVGLMQNYFIFVSSSEMIIFNKFLSFNARCNNQGRHFSERTSYKLLFRNRNVILAFLSNGASSINIFWHSNDTRLSKLQVNT